jgi:hypothetical protein
MNMEAPHDDEKMDLGFGVSLMVTAIAVAVAQMFYSRLS